MEYWIKVLDFLFDLQGCSIVIFFIILFLSFVSYYKGSKSGRSWIAPGRILFIGTFISATVYFFPYYKTELADIPAAINSAQHAFRLFSLGDDFLEKIVDYSVNNVDKAVRAWHINFGSFIYLFAPILTFGFLLTFFKNFFARFKYVLLFWTKACVFSELNEKSLALAESLMEDKENKPFFRFIPKTLIVFTDIIDKKEEQSLDLIDGAKKMGAIMFRKDLESVCFKRSGSFRRVEFYLISEDESEKIRHTESIVHDYDYKGVELFVFSDDIRVELLISTKDVKNIIVSRVNDIQALIYHNLYEYGKNLFDRARVDEDGNNVISAVIVGLGKYGQEMLKALVWYCQLEGYKLKINVFDANKKAEARIKAMCPELMSDEYNKRSVNFGAGEAYYEIDIHAGVDVQGPEFEEKLSEIDDATYIFVCLGKDEANLEIASKIRSICARTAYRGGDKKPVIETVIYDSNVKKRLGVTWEEIAAFEKNEKKKRGATNFKKVPYNIIMTGDLKSFYSKGTVINSALVESGFKIHKRYSTAYARMIFAQDKMEEEWLDFLSAEKLLESWDKHCAAQTHSEGNETTLSKKKEGFSFMTAEEEALAENAADKNELLKYKNVASERIYRWEKQVYKKFSELIREGGCKTEWKEKESEAIRSAEKDFRYEYNYRSSIAKAIHLNLRNKFGLYPKFTDDEQWFSMLGEMSLDKMVELGEVEHIRWNAYMRSEGYRYAAERDDMAKVHNKLVPRRELSSDDLRKDM